MPRSQSYVSSVAEASVLEVSVQPTEREVSDRLAAALPLLRAAADPVRWTVLHILATGDSSCVCDLQERVPIAANLLSYHLKVLRDAGLVRATRRGRWIDYALTEDALDRLGGALPGRVGADPVRS